MFIALLSLVHDGDLPVGSTEPPAIIAAPILRRLLSALHFRDAGTLKHSRRVGLISVGIAARLGWEGDDLRVIEIAALLHDIGKIGIPDHILRKPGKLGPDETDFISVHHRVALSLLQACQVHPDVTAIIAQSHGVSEEERQTRNSLSLGARILAVADAYDSLTSRQCFRAPYDRWEALQILEEQSGKQFDRNVVAALGRWLDSPEASRLTDERSAEVSIHVNAPVDMETRLNANQLCHVFHHLYLLETLYEAFYVIDASRQVRIWSSGSHRLFGRPPHDVIRKRWNRQLISPNAATTDQVESVFSNGQTVCHTMTVKTAEGSTAEVDVQSIPIQMDGGEISGVVELLCNSKESKRHQGQFRMLQIAATRDPLTGVLNRGELERKLQELYDSWSIGESPPFSVMFMDIDHFKSINDKLSHAVGDQVLIDCARMLQDELYSGEIIARYGGEEFVILCPETGTDSAQERAERLRRKLMANRFADLEELKVTASFGVSTISQDDSTKMVMARADEALYDAKRKGRNCTCVKLAETVASRDQQKKLSKGKLTVHTTMVTFVAADMLQLKLAGFVENHRAKILSVEPRCLELQVGGVGLLSGWSKSACEKIPVKLRIDLTESPGDPRGVSGARMLMKVQVEPVGRCSDEDQFKTRAHTLIEELRSYLIAKNA